MNQIMSKLTTSPEITGTYTSGRNSIVSDIGQPAGFASSDMDKLTTLKGRNAWEEVRLNLEVVRRYVEEESSVGWGYLGASMLNPG